MMGSSTEVASSEGELCMPVDVSPLIHIEMTVHDAEAAYQFLHDVFGAEKVEEEFAASFLDGPGARVIHVGLGDVVLQFIEPRVEEGSWHEQLKRSGPGVHNLTFVVDDIREVVKALEAEGAPVLFSFPLDWAELVGPQNVKPDAQPVHMVGSMEKIGFHLELAESPLREPPPPAPREIVGAVSPLLHVEIVVRDVDETCRFLHAVFGAERVEKEFASFLDSAFMKIAHVLLGDVVLQLCQPLAQAGSWYEQLRDSGPGVHNITFLVDDLPKVAEAMHWQGVEPLLTFPLDWGQLVGPDNVRPDVPNVHMMNTRGKLGFNLELAEKPSDDLSAFLYKTV
jgi:catechol 2,3-dioxygenase-like lactoylglutathione lyase family enzyme